ncbi:hypothetical protein GLYMA_06G042000v4 [Glycine max]|uniref:Uncharacterized protein n=1 Tax=Glycine max TaxID=3847 RepID=K7KT11_SOYBN|nr:hypothetical protein JHK85_014705 [Glycine max]KAG5044951.1 hypothetical protein JHK86_014357 [Glycine max]KAH1124113.1 hypothetical protein GYH30_014037 [Glycine max]KRH52026.1 hypothetical protein GLYMA_06G042000v4 [Glycine max]
MRDRRRTGWLYLKVRLSLVTVMGKLEFRISCVLSFDTHCKSRASASSSFFFPLVFHLVFLYNTFP